MMLTLQLVLLYIIFTVGTMDTLKTNTVTTTTPFKTVMVDTTGMVSEMITLAVLVLLLKSMEIPLRTMQLKHIPKNFLELGPKIRYLSTSDCINH
jgi:hypothetical protein